MDRPQRSAWITQFKRFMTPDTVDALGGRVGLCQRRRQITPWRVALSLVSGLATQRVDSLADLQRQYNALFESTAAYKPFHKQLAKPAFAEFMRELAGQALEQLRIQVLQPGSDKVLSAFDQVVIQDGSSFGVRDELADVFPGRFTHFKPAAVELQTTMALFEGLPCQLHLTPDTASERADLPSPEALAGQLLLADRGYFEWHYLDQLAAHNACFIMRVCTTINPRVVRAFDSRGRRQRPLEGQSLKALRCQPHQPNQVLDLDVYRTQRHGSGVFRLIISWTPRQATPCLIITNLDRIRYSADTVSRLYQLRWQIELLFKEYKSYAQLRAFRTDNPHIAEGLIWAAVIAATIQRFMAHLSQRVHGVEISTQKTAKAAGSALSDVFRALAVDRSSRIRRALEAALSYLAINAQRAHPQRDRRTGRSQIGLHSVGVVAA